MVFQGSFWYRGNVDEMISTISLSKSNLAKGERNMDVKSMGTKPTDGHVAQESQQSGPKTAHKDVVSWVTLIMLSVSILLLGFNSFQIWQLKNMGQMGIAGNAIIAGGGIGQVTGNAVLSGGGIDMAGWTENEKMMYEHHGTLPARLQGKTAPSASSSGNIDMSGWTENEKMMYEHHGTLPTLIQG